MKKAFARWFVCLRGGRQSPPVILHRVQETTLPCRSLARRSTLPTSIATPLRAPLFPPVPPAPLHVRRALGEARALVVVAPVHRHPEALRVSEHILEELGADRHRRLVGEVDGVVDLRARRGFGGASGQGGGWATPVRTGRGGAGEARALRAAGAHHSVDLFPDLVHLLLGREAVADHVGLEHLWEEGGVPKREGGAQ